MTGNRTGLVLLVAALAAVLTGSLVLSDGAWAQGEERLITLDLRDATLEDALALIFRATPYSYTLAPGVSGRVTLTLNNVTFTQALRAILEMHELTYRKEAGNVYYITRREEGRPVELPSIPTESTLASRQKIYWIGPGGRYELQYLDCRQVSSWFGGTNAGSSIIPVAIEGGIGGGGMGGGGGLGGGGLGGGGIGGGGLGGGGIGGGGIGGGSRGGGGGGGGGGSRGGGGGGSRGGGGGGSSGGGGGSSRGGSRGGR
jgi:hypothetical protein